MVSRGTWTGWRSLFVLSRGVYRDAPKAGTPLLWRQVERAVDIQPEKRRLWGDLSPFQYLKMSFNVPSNPAHSVKSPGKF